MVCLTQLAEVNDSDVQKIKKLEKELSVVLIAYKPLEFADLTAGQVKELQNMEKSIGVTIIAYR